MRGWMGREVDDGVRETIAQVERSVTHAIGRTGSISDEALAASQDAEGPDAGQSTRGTRQGGQAGRPGGRQGADSAGTQSAEGAAPGTPGQGNDGQGSGGQGSSGQVAPGEEWGDHPPSGGAPQGLGGPGANDGLLELVSYDGVVTAGVVDKFSIVPISSRDQQTLLAQPTDRRVRTVHLEGHGAFRVAALKTADGAIVVVGQSLGKTDWVMTQLLATDLGVAVVVVLIALFVGRWWVKREMRPLDVVASTARGIGRRDLRSEEIEPFARLDPSLARPGTEVGDVGHALNTMIDNVEGALKARMESERTLRQFVADASHELRTPLASIQGYTQLLQRDSVDAETALGRIASESARMSGLVEDLLLLARLDAGRELASLPVDLVPLVVDAVMDAHAAGPDHSWVLELPEGEESEQCVVDGDEAALRQVLANLVNNARVHTPAGTTVRIGVRAVAAQDAVDQVVAPDGTATWKVGCGPAGSVLLWVADDGPGIPEALRPTVFDRFVRGDGSRTRKDGKGSSGLGLSIVSSITKALGGRVSMSTLSADDVPGDEAARVAPTTGTRFEVRLPRSAG
ncbi:HAMP domain-containing histidine kinase [Schaalia sp. 19OD2882]|nr:HAMP domain-containing histidine kinase [Schaalia sp. 19OD2882]